MQLPINKLEFDILLVIAALTLIIVILTTVGGYSNFSADIVSKISRASSWITWVTCLASVTGVIYMVVKNKSPYDRPLIP